MSGLPKKFARMGFARGWRAYRASTQSRAPKRVRSETMAKRKRGRMRGFARKAARRGGVGNSAALIQLDAMAYGAVRPFVSNKTQELLGGVLGGIPGGVGDEVAMGLICWGVSKYAGKGMLGSVARKGLVIENARLGEAAVSMILPTTGPAKSNDFVYG